MDLGEMISDSLRYPFSDIKKFLLFFILLLRAVLLIPGIFAYGYLIKIIKSTIKGSDSLPDFTGSNEILEDGIKIYRSQYYIWNSIFHHYSGVNIILDNQVNNI